MARFSDLDPRLNPYAYEKNVIRARTIDSPRRTSSSKARAPGLSIVVLNLDSPDLLESVLVGFRAIRAEFTNRAVKTELIVGDTGSTDPKTLQLMSESEDGVIFVRNLRYHFSSNNNLLFENVRCEDVLFLNNDVLIGRHPESVVGAYECRQRTGDIVSVVLDFPDGTVQHRGVEFLRDERFFGLPFHPQSGVVSTHQFGDETVVPAVTGAFLMVDSELFAKLGGFDERFEAECQDIDLCLRARTLGVKCRVIDAGALVHIENATRPKGEENWSDRALFVRRWSSYIETL